MRAAEMRIGCGTLCWLLLLCRTASILVPGEWTTLRMKMTAFNANGWNGATYEIWNASNVGQTIDWQLTMRDSMYTGWNGNEWYLKDESDVILANGTMNSGQFEEFVTFSTTVGTVLKFTIDPTNGGYSSYHSWEIGTTTEIFYSVQEGAASSILHPTDLQFTMPGELLDDGTLSSGEQQLTVLVDVQVGDILAFSLLEGSESSPANVAWELSEPDGVIIYSAEYASIAGVKFPLLENFVVAGPAACIQNQASDLELYSSDIDFSSLYPKRMFTDDTYIYFVPPSSKFFRVDVATMTQVESVTVTGSDYQFGFSDGTYGYLVPGSMGSILERVELGNFDSMSLSSISASYIGYTDAVLWRSTYTYAFLAPRTGRLTLIDLDNFMVHRDVDDTFTFYHSSSAFDDGTYCYLVPYQDSGSTASGKLVRFDMAQFEAYTETFETLDLTAQSNSNAANWVQFSYGVEDGTYGYLVKETGGILLRFSLATFSNVEEFSVSLTGTTARALMVGDYIHIFYSQQGFGQWAQWYLGDNGTTVVDFTMDSSYESRDAVFTGDGIYLLVGVVMMPQWGMKKICQDWRSRTFTLQQCSRQVTEYRVSQELTGAMGSSFSDDVHLYHLSSTRLLYRINLHPTVTQNVLEFSSLTYGNGLTDYTFDGGFHDGNYGYLVPGIGDNFVFRFILETFNGGTFLDLSEIGQSGNCKDGFASGSYGFLLPAQDGIIFRINLTSFDAFDTEYLDLSLQDVELKKFAGGIQDGTYGYLAPMQDCCGSDLRKVVRFRLDPFEYVDYLDLSFYDSTLGGFEGIFTDGTYGYLYGGYSYKVVRFLLSSMSWSDVSTVSATYSFTSGSLITASAAYFLYQYNGDLERLELSSFAWGSSLTVDSSVSSWMDAIPTTNYELFMRSTMNYSKFYRLCEPVSSSSSCDGEVTKKTVSLASGGSYGSFFRAFADGMNFYLLPMSNMVDVWKVDLSTMNGVYINNYQDYMPGGFVVGSYIYLIPANSGQQVYRITESTFTYPAMYTLSHSVSDVGWGFTDGTYGYMAPGTSGHLGRFNLDLFTMDPSTYVDLTQIDSAIGSFHGGFHDGTYGYLVPHFDSSFGSSGKVVRFDLATFSTFEVLDVTDSGMYIDRRKFIDGFTDFEHGFLVPMGTDSRTFVRFSLKDFTIAGVSAVDLSSVSSSGTFKAGVVRVRYGYLFNDDGSVIKVHLKTLNIERLVVTTASVWWGGMDSTGTLWALTDDNGQQDFYSLCQDTVPFVNIQINCSATAEKLTAPTGSVDWMMQYIWVTLTDNIYAYQFPTSSSSSFLRISLSDYGTVETFSTSGVTLQTTYWDWNNGFFDSLYGYLLPSSGSEILRYDLANFQNVVALDLASSGSTPGRCQYFSGGFSDGTYSYFIPSQHGEVCRVDSNFNTAGVTSLNLQSYDSELAYLKPGFEANNYAYLAPYQTSSYYASGKMVRFDLGSFSSVDIVDLSLSDSNLKQFQAAITDGTYGYLVPDYYGKMARFQLDPYQLIDFQDVSSWSSSVSSGFSDGNYIYLYSGSTGTVLRVTWGIQNEEITLSGTVSGLSGGFFVQNSLYFFDSSDAQVTYRLCAEASQTSTSSSSSSSTTTTSSSSSSTTSSTSSSSSSTTSSTSSSSSSSTTSSTTSSSSSSTTSSTSSSTSSSTTSSTTSSSSSSTTSSSTSSSSSSTTSSSTSSSSSSTTSSTTSSEAVTSSSSSTTSSTTSSTSSSSSSSTSTTSSSSSSTTSSTSSSSSSSTSTTSSSSSSTTSSSTSSSSSSTTSSTTSSSSSSTTSSTTSSEAVTSSTITSTISTISSTISSSVSSSSTSGTGSTLTFTTSSSTTTVPVFTSTNTNTTTASSTFTTTISGTTTSSSSETKTTVTSSSSTFSSSSTTSSSSSSSSSSSTTGTSSSSTRTFSSTSSVSITSSTRSITTSSTISKTSTSVTSSSSTVSSTTSSTLTSSSSSSTSTTESTTSTSSTTVTSTSSSSTSSSSTTTLEGAYVVPGNVDTATPQGSVVQATLDSALLALNSPEDSIVEVTPQGTVTVLKVTPTEVSSGLVFQFDESGAQNSTSPAVTVQVPATTAEQAANGVNLMVSLTQVTQEVSNEMPYKKDNGDSVQFNSKVLEFSLLQESGGLITVVNLQNATEPVYFRFHESAPIEGDTCSYFDLATNTWSIEGVTLVNGSDVPNNDLPGTWCSATHLSIFAVVQIIPWHLGHDPEAGSLNANGAVVASALMCIMLCCGICTVCAVFLRRTKPASAGQTEIRDSKGNKHVVTYVRTEVIEETIHDDDEEVEEQKKKVLVKWDVDVAAMMRRLNTLRGHRWVSMDLGASRARESLTMTKEASKSITKRNLAKSEASGQVSEGEEGRVTATQTQRSDVFGPMESMDPEAEVELSPTNLNDVVLPERSMKPQASIADADLIQVTVEDLEVWGEVFEENAPVSYWSWTHQRMLQGFIQGKGLFLGEGPESPESEGEKTRMAELPYYDVRVGVRRQLRHAVPITHLESSLQVNESVHVWVEEFRQWKMGMISNCLHSAGMYQVMVFPDEMTEEIDPGVNETPPLIMDNITLERIRKRYAKNSPVRVYRGREVGWLHGLITEDVVQDLRPPVVMSPRLLATPRRRLEDKDASASRSVATAALSSDEPGEEATLPAQNDQELPDTVVEVKVQVVGQEEEVIPSYLLCTLPYHFGI